MTAKLTDAQHEALFQELCKLLDKYAGKLTSLEMLAVASNMVGKLVALQDQRITTRESAMETVRLNLELGNQQAVESLMNAKGGNA